MKALKNDEKWFLFHVKSSFPFWDIYNFVLTFWQWKNHLIRKPWLISKFKTSQTGQQVLQYIQLLPKISRRKGYQTLKFDQLIEYDIAIILKKSYLIVVEKLKSDPFMKNQDWTYLWIAVWNAIMFVLLFVQVDKTFQNIPKRDKIKVLTTCF